MLEQIKNISIKGGPFTEKTSFDLFPQRLNLLYGRNGSGKSTIAKSIRRLGKEDDGSGYSAETNPSLSAEQAQHIFVFDEDFVPFKVFSSFCYERSFSIYGYDDQQQGFH